MAESVASAAAENVTKQAIECASPYLHYFLCYGEIVQDFTNHQNSLKLRKQRVDTRVDEAKRQIEVIYEDVEDWLRRAEKELEETQNLQDEIDRAKCSKWCPQWGWRYCLSKKLAEKTPIISELLEASNFAQVGYRGSLQGIEFITSRDFMDSESSKSALNQVMEAIKVVNMIGLHGMPRVGKTTLAKEVGKHAQEQKLFDKVVMFTMSQNPTIKNIQQKVADIFGLKFETSSQEGKAEELFRIMQRVNKVLVIIDDLWEEFKLESIGIPCGDDHKGCKILLTTRHQQKEIQLRILSEDEAWVLFRDQAGLEDDCSILNEVAKEVAGECKGLPLAIVTVAKALKDAEVFIEELIMYGIGNDCPLCCYPKLRILDIYDCKSLKYVCGNTSTQGLQSLESVKISYCPQLMQIFKMEQNENRQDAVLPQIIWNDFPQLVTLENLGTLELTNFKRNSKLEQVLKLEDEVEVEVEAEAEEEMKIYKLEWLTLEELPSLIHFCPKGCHFVLPALIELKVSDCPKLTTSFFIDSQEFVYCKTKTPQLIEEDAIEESATVSNAIFNKNIC
ncbi:hypothetical protein J1N35_028267 [Gossypium stocksii]|uniref:AAA+ ATPase domain-containing protein n=1 Tax=Gossypium stocksii TaxID=47602 RepID=A0A9D3ZSI5_9ROSI|nr:hypothetical protein J1N35_028267 [Gossypium stocksii]